MSDTVEQPVLAPKAADGAVAALARIAGGLDLLASVLAAFPTQNPQVWEHSSSAKQLKDLMFACEHLRQHARQLEAIAQDLSS
jgi:hypothetical protein